MMNQIRNLWNDENGQGMVEYGLIIALVAVVAIGGLYLLGPKLRDMFTGIAASM